MSWSKNDPPPKRVKPCPVTVVLWLLNQVYNPVIPLESDMSLADIICIAFFFLLRPGEYSGTTSDKTTFTLNDVYLYLGKQKLSFTTATDTELGAATFLCSSFHDKKEPSKGQRYCTIMLT